MKKAGGLSAGLMVGSLLPTSVLPRLREARRQRAHLSATALARDETYWNEIRQAYRVAPDFINLENGYYSLVAEPVLRAQEEDLRRINAHHSFYMRRDFKEDRARLVEQVATLAGCAPEELSLCRNTTEALDTVIMGLQLAPGDEALLTSQDYYSMLQCFAMRTRRFGTVNTLIDLPFHPRSDKEIVAAYEKAITPRTKVLLVTHLINTTGQILPVRKIADMAHRHGVEVISDSAHAFAHTDFKIPDLGCDYLGASLHKWLGAPLGTGILYIKKEKIPNVWPLFGDDTYPADDIRKFDHIGTLPCHNDLAIAEAIAFHAQIGAQAKEERLRYLTTYWRDQVKDLPGVVINTPQEAHRYCAIANVGIQGMDSKELAAMLFDKYRIFTVAKDILEVKGVRVTPHLYTSLADLDHLVSALREMTA
ncbi:Selenocysteine lyase/Cysteine desulfurase [Catalinimonas alkaloidigena]|uniref:Selenocysteine lyase/Cysteine desulfurase n=1 Tax=Catalinimonas alkaloidigena TaxID=1075417 RepID=A0A1G9VDJ3_9BACT|nr:aminotransferase class V-fold PLP-dependent enzyme [Catalinimonas alkaloidigena]SDM70338.1 Selenocysteine lyase/Cysteine desulfurase [Catalinimonas alkaloidigena]